ncbi:MAG: protein-glutamate O-methyltransferase CheR [Phormidesmis sp.]
MDGEQAMQREIEDLLRRKIGLDPDVIGARYWVRAVKKGMRMSKIQNLSDYLEALKTSPALFEALVESVVVFETSFFHNRAAFAFLRQWVAQAWVRPERKRPNAKESKRKLRVLSVPCATGEEPYSIAITLLEAGLSLNDFQIDAVDISAIAISKAKTGTYSPYTFRRQGYRQDDKYFSLSSPKDSIKSRRTAQRYLIAQSICQSVSFIQGNVLDAELLNNRDSYDIIFCRNLLIYFDQTARDRTTLLLTQLLQPRGLLFVGRTEAALVDSTLYKAVPYPQTFAYRKQAVHLQIDSQLAASEQVSV